MTTMRDLFPDDAQVSKGTLRRHLSGPVANVQGFGARGDDAADDTPAIQAAIDHVEARGGGVVFIPAGTYRIMPQKSITEAVPAEANALVVSGSNVTLMGEGPTQTHLRFRVIGDRDPSDNFELAPWYSVPARPDVWRGSAIAVRGSDDPGRPRENIVISDMKIDGGTYPAHNSRSDWPADPETGAGWDISHKGIFLVPDLHLRRVMLRNLHLHNFRGEIIYGGGKFMDDIVVEGCELHGSNGDGISISASQVVRDNRIYDIAHACVESFHFGKEARYIDNFFADAKIGINLQTTWDAAIPAMITGNTFTECRENGILFNVENGPTFITNNLMIDCGWIAAHHAAIRIQPGNGLTAPVVSGIVINQNTLLRRRRAGGMGIMISCEKGRTIRSLLVSGNFIGTDSLDEGGRNRFLAPVAYAFEPGARADDIIIKQNTYFRPQRHAENLLSDDRPIGAPMPRMWENEIIDAPDGANNAIVTDGVTPSRMENEGPILLFAADNVADPTPVFTPGDYAAGQQFMLTNGDEKRRVYFPQHSDLFQCREGRYLVPNVELRLRFDGSRFVEVLFTDHRSRSYAEVTAGDVLEFRGFHDCYVSPKEATEFAGFSGIGHGARVRIIAGNDNCTLVHGETIQLRGQEDMILREGDVVELLRTRDGVLRQLI